MPNIKTSAFMIERNEILLSFLARSAAISDMYGIIMPIATNAGIAASSELAGTPESNISAAAAGRIAIETPTKISNAFLMSCSLMSLAICAAT